MYNSYDRILLRAASRKTRDSAHIALRDRTAGSGQRRVGSPGHPHGALKPAAFRRGRSNHCRTCKNGLGGIEVSTFLTLSSEADKKAKEHHGKEKKFIRTAVWRCARELSREGTAGKKMSCKVRMD